jgi:hypothetical protein
LEEELEKDRTVRAMRKWGFTGPITRQDYLDFIHATDDPQEPNAELESMLPQLLQDWSQFHWPHLSETERQKKVLELIEMASAHGFLGCASFDARLAGAGIARLSRRHA